MLNKVGDDSDDSAWCDCKFIVKEWILCLIISCLKWVGEFDCVDDHSSCANVEDFHDGVVDGVEGCEKVQVTGDKYDEEKFMRFDGDPCFDSDDENKDIGLVLWERLCKWWGICS